ncbi:MAG: hypothetical protein HQK79_17340 [Desulfobacterales bacterium]|nr:hypothetical protein [Desulfobacterales bacterium]
MYNLFLSVFLLISLVIGCVTTAQDLNKINIDMPKQEVIKILGTPSSVSANKELEYLLYYLPGIGGANQYFVKIIEGKVESFGRVGDFDSTKMPESKNNIDLNIKK